MLFSRLIAKTIGYLLYPVHLKELLLQIMMLQTTDNNIKRTNYLKKLIPFLNGFML